MKQKNGFIFIETMIVVVVLLASLLLIYSSYMGLISNNRRMARYDDSEFIYKTYSVGKFLLDLKDENGSSIIGNKIKEQNAIINQRESGNIKNEDKNKSPIVYISINDNDLFYDSSSSDNYSGNETRKDFFSTLYNSLNIQTIILVNKKQITSSKEGVKINESEISSDLYKYLMSIDVSNDKDDQSYLIVMYAEKVNGTTCDVNKLLNGIEVKDLMERESACTYYYANLKVQEVQNE